MARPRQADLGASTTGAALPETDAAPPAPGARLATNQLRRMRRIVDAAVVLAETGGFEAVRLRDVAERSDVALGTLYKYFRSKEDILLFALDEEMGRLEQTLAARPLVGGTPFSRAVEFFRRSTRALVRRAPFARALIRALTGSDQDLAVKVAAFQLRIAQLVAAALRGEPPDPPGSPDAFERALRPRAGGARAETGEREDRAARTLMHVWFSALVGWSAGMHSERSVGEQIRVAAQLILLEER
jgi:AcrR family transcriptional regulator